MRLSTNSIWVPDIEPYNMVNIEYLRGERESVLINSNGMVNWIPPIKMTSTCKIDKENTEQANCELKFGSWTYNGDKVNLKLVSY